MKRLLELIVVEDRTARSRSDEGFLRVRRLVLRSRFDDGTVSPPYDCDVVSRRHVDAVALVLFQRGEGGVRVLLRTGVRPPVALRAEKRLWLELVNRQMPQVALAKRVAISSVADFLSDRRVLELLLDELSSAAAATLFAPALLARCRAALHTALRAGRSASGFDWQRSAVARAVPAPLRAAVRNWRANRRSIEPQVLAFRAFIASRMQVLLGLVAASRAVPLDPAVNA